MPIVDIDINVDEIPTEFANRIAEHNEDNEAICLDRTMKKTPYDGIANTLDIKSVISNNIRSISSGLLYNFNEISNFKVNAFIKNPSIEQMMKSKPIPHT